MADGCPNEAVAIYAWAGKLRRACSVHLNAMKVLADNTGTPWHPRGLPPGQSCEHPNDLDSFKQEEAGG